MPDPESITPLLAERLDISTDRAETLLQSMIQELKSRTASEGVHLEELGTFEEENGTLMFTPSPSLRRRVNHQFEGLSPEDLSGPQPDRSEAEAPPSRESSGEEAETGPGPAEPSDEPPSEPEPAPDESIGAPAGSGDATERSIPTLDPIEDVDEGDETDVPPPDEPPEREEAEEEPPVGNEKDEEEEIDSPVGTFPVIGGLLMFVILLGVGWFVLTETNLWPSSQPTYETSEPETTQSADPEASSQSSGPELSDEASGDDQPDRYAGVQPGDEPGETPDRAADAETGSWTVVVASLSSRTEAEAIVRDYEDQFARVEVMPTTVDEGDQDRTFYRVAVGRYDSEAAAKRVLREKASMMPSDAWLHELP